MNLEKDTDMETAFALLPLSAEPSEELVRKLRFAARVVKPARSPWRLPISLSLAGAGIAVVAVMVALPSRATAKSFASIVQAAQRVNAFQFSIQSDKKGEKGNLTIAGQDGRIAMRMGTGMLMLIEPGLMTMYQPDENMLLRMKLGNSKEAEAMAEEMQSGIQEGFRDLDLKKMLKEYGDKYGRRGITISPVTRANGRGVYEVTLASPSQPDRVYMTVNAVTDLPDRMVIESRDGTGNWRQTLVMVMRFGADVDPTSLRIAFPKGARVQDIDISALVDGAKKETDRIKP